jgi:hypothetical protein
MPELNRSTPWLQTKASVVPGMLADNGCLSVNDMVTDRLRRRANKKAGGRSLPLF